MSWRRGERPQWKRWQAVRLKALDRDGWKCVCCGKSGRLEVDHIVSLNDGGPMYTLSNLQTLARGCHILKTRRENKRKPETPNVKAWQAFVSERLAST